MQKVLPGKYDKRWLAYYLVMILALGIILTICRFIFFKAGMNSRNIFSFFIISIILSSVSSAAGFLGARITYTFSIIGTVFGIIFMLYMYSSRTGFEDIAGVITFIMVYAAATVIGIIIEIIMYYRNKEGERGNKN